MKLNLGCGKLHREGYVNVDLHGGDVRADGLRLPFRDGVFDEILASHILEHVIDLEAMMLELSRVLRPGGILMARVPYGLESLYDPFHYRAFDETTMTPFCDDFGFSFQARNLFHMLSIEITDRWHPLSPPPFRYHLVKYAPRLMQWLTKALGIRQKDGKTVSLLGRPKEITFLMERVK